MAHECALRVGATPVKMLCWLVAALLAAPVLAADLPEHARTPAEVQTALATAMPELGQTQVLRGRFKQRKFLSEIPRPLLSSGEFLLVRSLGIWWRTQTPLVSDLVLTPAGLVERNGAAPVQPGAKVAASIFFALFALDIDTLAQSFDLFVTDSEPHWTLGLRPRDAAVAAWFERATIRGGERVEQVSLFESAGDRTEIDLEAVAQPLSSLTPAERKHFEP